MMDLTYWQNEYRGPGHTHLPESIQHDIHTAAAIAKKCGWSISDFLAMAAVEYRKANVKVYPSPKPD